MIPEQALELDLPTVLMDARGKSIGTAPPGVESMGYLAVEGKARVGLRFDSPDSNPSHLSVSFRLLEARYEPPADCSPKAQETILRLNSALNDRLLSAAAV